MMLIILELVAKISGKDVPRWVVFPQISMGLYGMEGNVSEWCQDWYDKGKTQRVLRGGSWYFNFKVPGRNLPLLRRAGRRYYASGFRCVVDLQQVATPLLFTMPR